MANGAFDKISVVKAEELQSKRQWLETGRSSAKKREGKLSITILGKRLAPPKVFATVETPNLSIQTWREYYQWQGLFNFFLVSCVGERPWWPLQSLNKGRKKKVQG